MPTRRIEDFPIGELEIDRAESVADIQLCQRALGEGAETYFDGKSSVQYRLAVNEHIVRIIDAELERRSKEAGTWEG